jgi:hypothetical protein
MVQGESKEFEGCFLFWGQIGICHKGSTGTDSSWIIHQGSKAVSICLKETPRLQLRNQKGKMKLYQVVII